MPRWVGIDYGSRRVGLALSDPGARIATPADALDAVGEPVRDARRVIDWSASYEPGGFVVGLPLNMDGSAGPQAELTRRFAAALERLSALPVRLHDERLSTYQADQHLRAAEVPARRRKGRRDALAAQVILQSFLDGQADPSP